MRETLFGDPNAAPILAAGTNLMRALIALQDSA